MYFKIEVRNQELISLIPQISPFLDVPKVSIKLNQKMKAVYDGVFTQS